MDARDAVSIIADNVGDLPIDLAISMGEDILQALSVGGWSLIRTDAATMNEAVEAATAQEVTRWKKISPLHGTTILLPVKQILDAALGVLCPDTKEAT